MALTSGTRLGPYEIVSPLGAGGMGEVYRARDTRLDREVAVKVLPANLSSDPNLRQRLEREAKAVSRLSHAHICTLHDIGHQDGVDFLVMEYLEGVTLEHRLNRGPLPPEQTVCYAVQIADALAKAHKLGITHRDLKPSNIMLTKSGAKLMDFGLAKQTPLAAALTEMTVEQLKLTSEGMLVGTFQYMAPEQLQGTGSRRAHRHLCPRGRSLRDAHRQTGLCRQDPDQRDERDLGERAGAYFRRAAAHPPSSRSCGPAGAGEGSRRALAKCSRCKGGTEMDCYSGKDP